VQEYFALLAILGAVYALECSILLPTGALWLHAPWLRNGTLGPGPGAIGLRGRFLMGVNPLPPFGESFLLCDLPFRASPDAVRLDGTAEFVSWESIDGSALARLRDLLEQRGFEREAIEFWLSSLRSLAAAPPKVRRGELEGLWSRRFALKEAHARVSEVRTHTRSARMLGSLQWIMIAFGIPLVVVVERARASAVPVFSLVVCVHLALVWLGRLSHGDLYGRDQPWRETAMHLVSPLHAMRVAEHVGREALLPFDPQAALLAAGRPEQFLEAARGQYRELQDEPPGECVHSRWWRSARQRAHSGLLREVRINPAHFDLAVRGDESARSFCPNCRALYAEPAGFCSECTDVALRRLSQQQILDAQRVLGRIEERRPH